MTLTAAQDVRIAGELRHVDKWYGEHQVLDDVSVSVGRGEIVALIGRSGSGKSTVLRVFSGLSTDHTGGRTVCGAPALAFQEPRLFPWRDVRTNVVYGLTRSRLSRPRPMRAPTRRWRTWGSPTAPKRGPTLSVVRHNGFHWRAPWSPSRNCCCSTNRSVRSTR